MNDQQRFIALLKEAKRKLWKKHLAQFLHFGLVAFSLVMLFMMLLARVIVITHLLEKTITLFFVILIGMSIYAWMKRPTNEEAASYYDRFVLDNDVSTTLHFLNEQSVLAQLQRRSTLKKMKKTSVNLRAEKIALLNWKPIFVFVFFVTITVILSAFPNDTMKLATEKQKEEEIVKKAKEDLKKLADENQTEELKELEDKTKEWKDSKQLLEELLNKEAQLEKEKQIAEDNEDKLKEVAQKINGLEELSDALNTFDTNKLDDALKKLTNNGPQSLTAEEKQALEELFAEILEKNTPSIEDLTEQQLDELLTALGEELTNLMDSANSLEGLLAVQEQLQNLATALQQSMFQNGLSNSNQLAFGEQPQTSEGNQGSQQSGNNSDSSTNETSSGDSKGEGSGNGSTNGSGSGSGTGSGSGSGAGGGSGTGSGGSGAGFGQGSRELTIPEKIAGEENLEQDFGELGKGSSKFQTSKDGLVIKGNVRSYEEVYGQYRDTYRKSVDRMELPTYLEDVVKDYFTDLDPKGE